MMKTGLVQADGALTLNDLQTFIRQRENLVGPLVAISPFQNMTWLTMADGSAPANPIELVRYENDAIPSRPGKALICIGDCFIERQPASIAAFR